MLYVIYIYIYNMQYIIYSIEYSTCCSWSSVEVASFRHDTVDRLPGQICRSSAAPVHVYV